MPRLFSTLCSSVNFFLHLLIYLNTRGEFRLKDSHLYFFILFLLLFFPVYPHLLFWLLDVHRPKFTSFSRIQFLYVNDLRFLVCLCLPLALPRVTPPHYLAHGSCSTEWPIFLALVMRQGVTFDSTI